MTDEYKVIVRYGDVEIEYNGPTVGGVLELYCRAYEDEPGADGWEP